MSQKPNNEAAILKAQPASLMYPLQQQQFPPYPLPYYGLPISAYGMHPSINMPQWPYPMPNMASIPQTSETQKLKEIEDGIAKLKRFNIIDNNFERNREKFNLNGTAVEMPAFNKSRRLELLEAKKPVATYKPFILDKWTKADYIRHKNLREEHMKENNLESNTPAEKNIMLENRRITMQTVKVDILKKDRKAYQTNDRWWVVVDTKVLLDDMWFIEKLINSDPYCRLKLPYETLHDLSQLTMKFRPPWMRAPARRVVQLLEKKSGPLKMINQQGPIENEDLIDNAFATDAVLNCCMQMMRYYYFVVLITDDSERREKAKAIDLPSYSFVELKDLVTQSYTNIHFGHITITREFGTYS